MKVYFHEFRKWVDRAGVIAGALSHNLTIVDRKEDADFVACWGGEQAKKMRDAGCKVLVFECGYAHKGNKYWTRVSWNGINNEGDPCLPASPDIERARRYITPAPWRDGGTMVLLAGQVRSDASSVDMPLRWNETITTSILRRKCIGLPVFFKPHPRDKSGVIPRGATLWDGSMREALNQAYMVVCWNSNAAVDAVLAGCPAVTFNPAGLAWEVSSHDILERKMPDRTLWVCKLASSQWRPREISSGAFWPRMLNGFARCAK